MAEPPPLPYEQPPSSWGQRAPVSPRELRSRCLRVPFPAPACTQLTSAASEVLRRAWIYS